MGEKYLFKKKLSKVTEISLETLTFLTFPPSSIFFKILACLGERANSVFGIFGLVFKYVKRLVLEVWRGGDCL